MSWNMAEIETGLLIQVKNDTLESLIRTKNASRKGTGAPTGIVASTHLEICEIALSH